MDRIVGLPKLVTLLRSNVVRWLEAHLRRVRSGIFENNFTPARVLYIRTRHEFAYRRYLYNDAISKLTIQEVSYIVDFVCDKYMSMLIAKQRNSGKLTTDDNPTISPAVVLAHICERD